MKNKFIICMPRSGKASASIVTHRYDVVTKRTRTVYLGSLSVHADPEALRACQSLAPGQCVNGVRLSAAAPWPLEASDILFIATWLEAHGTACLAKARARAEADVAERERRALHERIRAEVRQELRVQLEHQLRDEQERQLRSRHPLDVAEDALLAAAVAVESEAKRLAGSGERLGNVRSANLSTRPGMSKLDALQVRANRLRLTGVEHFEEACKRAGLMASRRASPG